MSMQDIVDKLDMSSIMDVQVLQTNPPGTSGHRCGPLCGCTKVVTNLKGGTGMADVILCDIDMTILRSELEDACNNYANNNGWNYELKDMRTRSGKDVVTLIDKDQSGELNMFYDKQTNMVTLKPHKFGSKNYVIGETETMVDVLKTFTKKGTKNRLSYIENGIGMMAIDGRIEKGDLKVVKAGTVADIDADDDDDSAQAYKVRIPINQYLNENPVVKTQIYNTIAPAKDMTSFVNAFGKHLIAEKGTGNMEFKVFRDLLNQCVILGATDPTVLKIRSLIM